MGMPDAYVCEVCDPPVYFDNTAQGRQDLQEHYRVSRHSQQDPDSPNAYRCHYQDCNSSTRFARNACLMVEHYRTEH